MSALASCAPEATERFACFGGSCSVSVTGTGAAGTAPVAVERVKRRLLEWHAQFSRFDRTSELSRLNRDPRECVPVSPMMARFVEAALAAAALTGGLVDPTLVDEVERAGYADDFRHRPLSVPELLRAAATAQPARPSGAAGWRLVQVDRRRGTVTRPVGVRLDSGGIAKGLFGDVLASLLSWHEAFAVESAGDVRFGGTAGSVRAVRVTSPFDPGRPLYSFELVSGAAATSGITKRSWRGQAGQAAHHLLDPATGQPAFTGVVQATALAPSGLEAEARAKAALLAGRGRSLDWLPHGGLVVYDDGAHDLIEPDPSGTLQ
jgi:thiamine biosynthesis lipoprotein